MNVDELSRPIKALALFSGDVLEKREYTLATSPSRHPARLQTRHQKNALRAALASRDPTRVFCAVLEQHDAHTLYNDRHVNPCTELELLLRHAEAEATAVATVLCACVAVALNPSDWPSWVSARFTSAGVHTLSAKPSLQPARGSRKGDSANGGEGLAASPLHALAADTLRRVASRIPRHTAKGATPPPPSLSLLLWLAQLCGVCLAPSSDAALHLAKEVGKVSLDAAGVALFAHAAVNITPAQSTTTREERWLHMWADLTQPSHAPPALPPFALSAAVTPSTGVAVLWADGLQPDALREARVSWHLHCLLCMKDAQHAARLLRGACHDVAGSRSTTREGGTGMTTVTDAHAMRLSSLPIAAATQAELLTSLPLPLLEADGLGESLTFSLLTRLRSSDCSAAPTAATGAPPSLAFVPAVATHAVLYARMLRYLLASAAAVQRESGYVQHLHDVALLLSSANVHALAASFVPADEPLTVVMVAAKDAHREAHVQQLVGAVRAVVDALCEEPTPLSAVPGASGAALGASESLTPTVFEGDVPSKKRKRTRRTGEQARGMPSIHASSAPVSSSSSGANGSCPARGASSWKWREDVMDDVDGAVQAAVRLLTSLLELCSSRRDSLPTRAAEPKWRRELRERTAVRAHKFELLLQELPHAELRAVLHTLLGHGYHREGSRLGVSLLRGDQVDLRFYTLPLLGSLYLAVSTAQPALSPATRATAALQDEETENGSDRWKQAVYSMYRRRFEIYGDADLNVTSPSYSTPAAKTTTAALVRTPENMLVEALVLASSPSPGASPSVSVTAEFANCLLNRRAVVAGRGVVVDAGVPRGGMVFEPWIRKGTISL